LLIEASRPFVGLAGNFQHPKLLACVRVYAGFFRLRGLCRLCVELFRFVHPPARSLDVDNDGVMDHAVNDGGGDDGISKVIAQFLEGDVGRDKRGALAVPAVDDLEEKRGIPGVMLFQPVEANFIDEKDVGSRVLFEPLVQAVVGQACEKISQHVCRRGIAATVKLFAAN